MERDFAGYTFQRVGAVEPERDGRGAVVEYKPKAPDAPLHQYGEGPFCRFQIARESHWRRSGVYVVTCGDAARYVGECKDLSMIWNFVGHIRQSSARKGGHQTHCRINNLILNESKRGAEVTLWFHPVEDPRNRSTLKARLIDVLNPPWRLTRS